MIAIGIEEEHKNQTHKIPVEHQPRANLIMGKQKVNKINSNSKAINKGKTAKNKKPKANKPCWNYGQVGHWTMLCPNKKAKTGQVVVNIVVKGSRAASTSGATEWIPSLKYFRVAGCLAKVLVPEHKRKKLGPKTIDVMFLDYVETRIPSSISLDDSLASTSIPEHVEKMTNVGVNPNSTSLTHEESNEPRRSKRAKAVKDFGSDFVTYNIEDYPVTFKDAMACSEAKQWKETVKSEMDPLFLTKHSSIDYNRVLIALALVYNLPIHQIDVKTAFLYGELEEEIYMDQPEGFVANGNEHKVCKLVKSLYGLKQAPKQWHEKFDKTFLVFGFTVNENDKPISQSHYVEKIIEKFGYQNSRIAKMPYDYSIALFKNESGVSIAQLRVLRYLKGTVSLAIHYGRFATILEGYSDASWIAKTPGVIGVQEAEWLFGLLSQLSIISQPLPPIAIHCDSQTRIAKVRSRKYNQKTKRHIQVRLKSIRALVSDRVIGINSVGTKDNVADPLTKGLDLSQVNKFRLGMRLETNQL
ncbi:UNVERIFIED_CONTAM: Retrovirus-related Pol polyprotein from transposon TNT 1-94 [Sesamum calycinum]|uniref:Retrovirus-related Pol polyprotein from transposon TNT 1-94 n=1 Tax=Sesamum calycinum TaxID=2727403 RepID=A0AAW2SFW6_9LAMI